MYFSSFCYQRQRCLPPVLSAMKPRFMLTEESGPDIADLACMLILGTMAGVAGIPNGFVSTPIGVMNTAGITVDTIEADVEGNFRFNHQIIFLVVVIVHYHGLILMVIFGYLVVMDMIVLDLMVINLNKK